jgi:predicted NACHT family NTPase
MTSAGIPRQLALTWLDEEDMVSLFDGLDGMPASLRDEFVGMLEKLQQQRGPVPVVVSCRVADYE